MKLRKTAIPASVPTPAASACKPPWSRIAPPSPASASVPEAKNARNVRMDPTLAASDEPVMNVRGGTQ
jgi:hypothetical protein